MSYGLITEFLPDKPQVLILAESNLVSTDFIEKLKSLQLQETVVPPDKILDPSILAQAYKIIWFRPRFGQKSSLQAESDLCQNLQPHQGKLLVVSTFDQPLVGYNSETAFWAKTTQLQTEFLAKIQALLPKTTVLLGCDVSGKTKEHLAPVVHYIISSVTQGKILDPQLVFYPQTWESLTANVLKHLSKPTKPLATTVLIKGKKLETAVVAKILQLHYQRLTGVLPIIESHAVLVAPLPQLLTEISVQLENSEVLINLILDLTKNSKITPTDSVEHLPTTTLPYPIKKEVDNGINQPIVQLSSSKPTPTQKVNAKPIVSLSEKTKPTPLLQRPASEAESSPPAQEIEVELSRIFQEYRSDHKVKQVQKVAKSTITTKKKSLRKKKFFWLGLIVMILIIAVSGGLGVVSVTSQYLRQAVLKTAQASTLDTQLSPTADLRLWHSLATAQKNALAYAPKDWFSDTNQLVRVSESLFQLETASKNANQASLNLFLAMTSRYPADVTTLLTRLTTQEQTVFSLLSQAQVYLRQVAGSQTEEDRKTLIALETLLQENKKQLSPLQQLQPFLPQLLGLEGKKTYAFVLQNHQELRPMGGVIQAVAFVTLDKGIIVDTDVMSAASITSPLAAAAASLDMVRFLGKKNIQLADSSWSPDAPTSADQTLGFLEQATTKNIDGIWFLNTLSLSEWVKTVGPLEIAEYKEVITHQNLLERLEAHSELQVPGQSRPEFSTLVLEKLLQRTQVIPQEKITPLLRFFYQQLESKQLAMVFKHGEAQIMMKNLGWSGSLVEPACPTTLQQEHCLVDTLAQVESNVGQNKANIYLERTVEHTVTLLSDAIQHRHSITFTNTSASNAWPRGPYKAYIRLYVPPTSRLEAVKFDGQNVPSDQIVIRLEDNRQVFGALIEVPINSKHQLSYEYFLPSAQATPFSYALFTQFQPGIKVPPYQVTLETGDFKPVLVAPQASITGTTTLFKPPTTLHSLVGTKVE